MGQRLEDIRRLRERMATSTLPSGKAEEERLALKRRILGVLLRDARQSSGRSVEDAAAMLGISPGKYRTFEAGSSSPTLPQMEVLAYTFNVPLSQLWGGDTIATKRKEEHIRERIPTILALRDRIIGVRLRQLREQASLTPAELSDQAGIDVRRIRSAELGRISLPVSELEMLVDALRGRVMDMAGEGHGPVGSWLQTQEDFDEFASLPPELRAFILKPINRSYLELATKLAETDVDKLRTIAESLLEITL